jgi:hypothetical protein
MKGLISYSHEDHSAAGRLRTHLRAIERAFDVEFWWDERLKAGNYWSDEIERAIFESQVFILAVTPDFIASDYIYGTEMPAIRLRRQSGCLVVPVVLKRCCWEVITGPIQAVPSERARLKPVDEWPREDGFDRARAQIRSSIEQHFSLKIQPFNWRES